MKKHIVLIILVFVFLIISFCGCTPASTLDPPHNVMENPKGSGEEVYRNENFKFVFVYPTDVTIQVYEAPFEVRVSTGPADTFSISATLDYLPGDVLYFLDTEPSEQRVLGYNTWQTYELPNGYCDGPECSSSIYALQMEVGQVLYKVVFYNQMSMTPIQEQILSTLQILP